MYVGQTDHQKDGQKVKLFWSYDSQKNISEKYFFRNDWKCLPVNAVHWGPVFPPWVCLHTLAPGRRPLVAHSSATELSHWSSSSWVLAICTVQQHGSERVKTFLKTSTHGIFGFTFMHKEIEPIGIQTSIHSMSGHPALVVKKRGGKSKMM